MSIFSIFSFLIVINSFGTEVKNVYFLNTELRELTEKNIRQLSDKLPGSPKGKGFTGAKNEARLLRAYSSRTSLAEYAREVKKKKILDQMYDLSHDRKKNPIIKAAYENKPKKYEHTSTSTYLDQQWKTKDHFFLLPIQNALIEVDHLRRSAKGLQNLDDVKYWDSFYSELKVWEKQAVDDFNIVKTEIGINEEPLREEPARPDKSISISPRKPNLMVPLSPGKKALPDPAKPAI